MEHLLHELVVNRPDDPLSFLAEVLTAPVVPKVIICGPPASGKGTQCEMLQQQYGVVHISTGDLLRSEVKLGTKVGKEASAYMERGELVPDELVVAAVAQRLTKEDVKQHGWVLDGFPRTRQQALALQAAGVIPQLLVLLSVPDEVAVDRIEGRRIDPVTKRVFHLAYDPPPIDDSDLLARLEHRAEDTRETTVRRLAVHHRSIPQVLECYQPILHKVNGDRDKQDVYDDIDAAVSACTGAQAP
eukprot:TRINITY_DN18119_c0_g1_i1.p2 TRINITY_DN18119_c0_g1~~TRINITY_DN18119_c0_g1_i1.p2  ORF type:complete len:244 (+),score=66.52 TRINITY_DN18119_c0_g1_i1:169-900(+)